MNNLLVWDNEIITGGVETIQLNLIPALAKKFKQVIWVLPDHKLQYFKEKLNHWIIIILQLLHWVIIKQLLEAY